MQQNASARADTGRTASRPPLREHVAQSVRRYLRDLDGVDANDVVLSYAVQWDADHPLHLGRDNSFTYFPGLFGGFLNPPPPAPEG